jgi:hypothetical protein
MNNRKICPHCQRSRPRGEFGQNICNPDGLATYCRECSAEKQRLWKAANAEKVARWRKAYVRRIKAANRARQREQGTSP